VAKKPIGGNATDSGIFECTAFSVVNGAQTVGSIHAAAKQDVQAVNKAMVSVRIISIADGSPAFGLEVTRNTNTQNAVEKRDFVHSIQRKSAYDKNCNSRALNMLTRPVRLPFPLPEASIYWKRR